MYFLLAGFAGDEFDRDLQVLDAAGDIGIAGRVAGLAAILMVHGPAIEAVAGDSFITEYSPLPGTLRSNTREVTDEPCTKNTTGRAGSPALARRSACETSTTGYRPSWSSIRCSRSRRLPKERRSRPGRGSRQLRQGRALQHPFREKRASRQRISGVRHVSSPRDVLAWAKSNSAPDGLK